MLRVKPNKKYQSYSPRGIESELPHINSAMWDCRDQKNADTWRTKNWLENSPWHMDIHLMGAYKVKTASFPCQYTCFCLWLDKPNCFVVHHESLSFQFCLLIFFVCKNVTSFNSETYEKAQTSLVSLPCTFIQYYCITL